MGRKRPDQDDDLMKPYQLLTRDIGLDTITNAQQRYRFGADSSVGRALPLQGRGHRFNPCSAYQAQNRHYTPEIFVALRHDTNTAGSLLLPFFAWGRRSAWLGRQIVNLEVAGSNPVGPATFLRYLRHC